MQSLGPHALERLTPDHFDIIVIDEFHHAESADAPLDGRDHLVRDAVAVER